MDSQLISKIAMNDDRPSMIVRLTDAEALKNCGLELVGIDEDIEELAFLATPLASCATFEDHKWLVQVYVRSEHYEFTGYPNGRKRYENNFDIGELVEKSYSMNEQLPPFLQPTSQSESDEGGNRPTLPPDDGNHGGLVL